jgi:trigger factor
VSEEEVEVALKDLRRAFAWQEAEKQHIQMTHEEFEKNLPEINEEWAKKMGSDSLVDLKAKIKKEITETKLYKEKQKRTSLLMEKIIEEANFSLPNIMIEEELDRMELEMKADLERMGLDFQHYLEHIKKTASDLRKDNRKTAENRAKSRLVLIKVASRENIKPDEKLVSEKVDSIIKENPSLDKEKVKNYIFHTHTLEAAWNFLENL